MRVKKTNRTYTDWAALKQQYLTGNIETVDEFLRVVTGRPNGGRTGHADRMTKGWREERQQLQRQAVEATKTKHIEQVKPLNEKLLQAKEDLLYLAIQGLKDFKELIEFDQHGTPMINRNASGLKTIWEMLKVELGEPLTINKNLNENKDYTLADVLNALNDNPEKETAPIQN